ncbi:hypothetical protein RISK_000713 [Rhodopirellula islandica]|uniref:Uncharacterized protein n=1 Tax=Rhodopirellula islandica TaxID=595434 RepID=A0A0J1BK77_RHOIS|nr:hypothetical protein RISK_000713 [Rhodopirellula islandica]
MDGGTTISSFKHRTTPRQRTTHLADSLIDAKGPSLKSQPVLWGEDR